LFFLFIVLHTRCDFCGCVGWLKVLVQNVLGLWFVLSSFGAPSDSKTKPWLSHMPILQVSCCRTLGPLLPVASHSSAIACCVALEQRLGRAKFFAACMVGQIRCFGVNATSPRARESGSSCGHLIQAYLLVSSMAQAATLSMYPSSWISKIGMHANTFRIESFEFSQLASVTQLN